MKLTHAEKNAYDALTYLIESARLPVTPQSIKEELYLHPDFPSMLAISDALTEWKINNLATRIGQEQLVEIPLPAIAYLDNQGGCFAPIRKVTDEKVEWLDTSRGWLTDSLFEFSHKWNGVVLLIEPDKNSGEINYQQKKKEQLRRDARVPAIALGFLACMICAGRLLLPDAAIADRMLQGLLLTKLIGVGVTSLLLWHTVDASNELLRSLCSLDSRTDCNNVLTSSAAKLWGWLSWSEIGFAYFTGSFLALLLREITAQTSSLSWLLLLNALALPYTVYSIYYQYKVARSWCTLCVLVQLLLWVEFALGLPYWPTVTLTLSSQTIALFGLAFLPPITLWMLLKKPLQEATQVFPLRRELQRAKFNPDYVESLFAHQPQMPPVFEGMRLISIGNPRAEHTLTVVTNPLCGPCRRLHPQLEALVQRTKTINCQFVFIGSTTSVTVAQKLLSLDLIDAQKALNLWYKRNDNNIDAWNKVIDCPSVYSDLGKQMELNVRWCEMAQITSTPTLYLDGRQLPLAYVINDVENLCRLIKPSAQSTEFASLYKSIV